jgi:hypothetical protein
LKNLEDFQKNVLKLKNAVNDPILYERKSSTVTWTNEILSVLLKQTPEKQVKVDPKHLSKLETELYHLQSFYDFSPSVKRQETLGSAPPDARSFIQYAHQNPILGNKMQVFFSKQDV